MSRLTTDKNGFSTALFVGLATPALLLIRPDAANLLIRPNSSSTRVLCVSGDITLAGMTPSVIETLCFADGSAWNDHPTKRPVDNKAYQDGTEKPIKLVISMSSIEADIPEDIAVRIDKQPACRCQRKNTSHRTRYRRSPSSWIARDPDLPLERHLRYPWAACVGQPSRCADLSHGHVCVSPRKRDLRDSGASASSRVCKPRLHTIGSNSSVTRSLHPNLHRAQAPRFFETRFFRSQAAMSASHRADPTDSVHRPTTGDMQ